MAKQPPQDPSPEEMAFNLDFNTTPILYTDNVFMTTNQYGLILDVGQRIASTNQIKIVSRIGMSREHAKQFIAELSKLLAMTEGQLQTGKKHGQESVS